MKKVGVVLSGCGVYDGSEIHEATLTLLALDRADVDAVCFAPDVEQMDVVDHRTSEPLRERRNVLAEAARIARGKIADLREARAANLDGLIFPGGYGAAKNLCDFAKAGADAKAHPEVARIVREMHENRKPMAFLCIAPAIAAAVFRGTGIRPKLTIGTDEATGATLGQMGAAHERQPVDGVTIDRDNRIVSTPCYMLASRIREVDLGIERAVRALLQLAS